MRRLVHSVLREESEDRDRVRDTFRLAARARRSALFRALRAQKVSCGGVKATCKGVRHLPFSMLYSSCVVSNIE